MRRPLISIIVPVYNVERHLKKCLDSIINQTMQNFEVILINDGSTDNCSDILESYCEKYNKFTLIKTENSGVSASRNLGLSKSNGEFIIFIDSDDFITSNFLDKLYKNAKSNKSDVVICDYLNYNSRKNKNYSNILRLKPGVYRKPKILRALICDTRIHHHIWNKLFRRSLLIDNNITFNNMCFEDVEFTIKAFYFANNISVINDSLYYYVRHDDSTISTMSLKKLNDYLITISLTRIFLTEQGEFKTYKFCFFIHSIRTLFISTKLIFKINIPPKSYKRLFCNLKDALLAIINFNSKNFDPKKQDFFNIKEG